MEVSDFAAGKVGSALSFSGVGTYTCCFSHVGNGFSVWGPGVLSFVI